MILFAVLTAMARNLFSASECERVGFLVPSKLQLVLFLDPYGPTGKIGGGQLLVVSVQEFAIVEITENTAVAERKAAENSHDGNKVV